MKITKNMVVSIAFNVKTEEGEFIDQVEASNPLDYLHGHQNLVPGLEQAIHGKSVGESFEVTLKPSQAYGEYDENLVQRVPKDLFETDEPFKVGMRFIAETDQGPLSVQVTKVDEDEVVVDGNHMLADQTLHFKVQILAARQAKKVEIEHGHPHKEDTDCCASGSCEEEIEHKTSHKEEIDCCASGSCERK